jgi:hypothetical protein
MELTKPRVRSSSGSTVFCDWCTKGVYRKIAVPKSGFLFCSKKCKDKMDAYEKM